jgi:hypothetical protein
LVAPVSKLKSKKVFKKFLPAIYSVVSVAAVFALLVTFNISLTHPRSGLDTALGDAKSSLMIVQSRDNYVVGDSIVGSSKSQTENPVFGVIAAVGEGVYMLNGNLGYVAIDQAEVKGKVLAIAPWWGKLAGLLGF